MAAPPAAASRRRRRRGGCLLVLVLLLAALVAAAVAGDATARSRAEAAVAEQVQRETGLGTTPQVDFPDGSFLLQAARGRFDAVTITAPTAPAAELGTDVDLRDVRVRLDGVTVQRQVLLGRAGELTTTGGEARALVPWAALEERVRAAGADAVLSAAGQRVRATTSLRVLGQDVELALDVAPRLDGDDLLLVPEAASLAGRGVGLDELRDLARSAGLSTVLDGVGVPLQGLPAEVSPRGLRVVEQGVVVDADVQPVRQEVPAR
ncbi:DUF2993 domain-containing protein [Kineococcus glutinatus]|uniref:DUF2993 family protein n=1 Tax=Kineococcus glutinatus TaxID=1070872 RepID=A0ABP9HL86_9ACTN